MREIVLDTETTGFDPDTGEPQPWDDVASGEVVIAYSIRDNLLSGIEDAYVETWEIRGGGDSATLRSTSAVLDQIWLADAHARVMRRLCARIAE